MVYKLLDGLSNEMDTMITYILQLNILLKLILY